MCTFASVIDKKTTAVNPLQNKVYHDIILYSALTVQKTKDSECHLCPASKEFLH